jgi:hypothetical protein
MNSLVTSEIIAREARIDPSLDAARAGRRLIAIGQTLALAAGDWRGRLSVLDLLLAGAAVCSVAAASEQVTAGRCREEVSRSNIERGYLAEPHRIAAPRTGR